MLHTARMGNVTVLGVSNAAQCLMGSTIQSLLAIAVFANVWYIAKTSLKLVKYVHLL